MGKKKLTRLEALNLITPVVDQEASADECEAFFEYIAEHDDIRRKYESIRSIKKLVSSRVQKEKAPGSLEKKVNELISAGNVEKSYSTSNVTGSDEPIFDIPCEKNPGSYVNKEANPQKTLQVGYSRWIFSAAASFFIIITVWTFYGFNFHSNAESSKYYVEESAYKHFIEHEKQDIEPNIVTASLGAAEKELTSRYNMPITIPKMRNAQFEGVVFHQFLPDFDVPMLEYHLTESNKSVYVFAFELNKLEKFQTLLRNPDAIEMCQRPRDFYIQEFKNKFIVSWTWDETWYTAISNHNGEAITSLVQDPE